MKRLMLIAAAFALPLGGCAGFTLQPSQPAVLEQTTLDETLLTAGLQSLKVATDLAELLEQQGQLVPGSERAIQVAGAIDTAADAYEIARAARDAGSTREFSEALTRATDALAKLNLLISGATT